MLRFSTVSRLSVSILSLAMAGLFAPTLSADDTAAAADAIAAASAGDEVKLAALDSDYARPDYSQMTKFMKRDSVNSRGRPSIAYNDLRKDSPEFFGSYGDYLVNIDTSGFSQDDQLAYWLNLQNFLVVKAITEDTKKTNLKSLRGSGDKPGKLWTKERVDIGGNAYSIADIENKIIAEFDNPNVIYGLYQGVKGAPCLSETPYEGASVTARLDELGKQYVNSRGIVTPEKGVASVTPIYDWYKADLFEDNEKTLLAHLKTNAATHLRGRLNTVREIKYTKLNYDIDNFVPQANAKKKKRKKSSGGSRPAPSSSGSGGGGGGGGGSYGS